MSEAILLSLFVGATTLLQLSPAVAEGSQNADIQVEAKDDETDRNRRICKTFRVTGSRAKRERICKTERQWAAHEASAKEEMRRATAGVCADRKLCMGE